MVLIYDVNHLYTHIPFTFFSTFDATVTFPCRIPPPIYPLLSVLPYFLSRPSILRFHLISARVLGPVMLDSPV